MLLGFGMPGGPEWIIILVIALLIFGSRLPKVMRSLGQSVSEFKKGVNEQIDMDADLDEKEDREEPKKKTIA